MEGIFFFVFVGILIIGLIFSIFFDCICMV